MSLSPDANQPKPSSSSAEKPDIEKEVAEAMGNMSIEDLMAQSLEKAQSNPQQSDPNRPSRGGRPGARRHSSEGEINPDNIKHGKIVSIREGNAFVDLGGKSQGICPLDQFNDASGAATGIEIGQEFEFVFKGYDNREGLVLLARKGAIVHGAWETLQPGDTVEADVTGVNKGGLELKVGASRAFMPAGQVDVRFHQDLSVFLNQRLSCRVMKVDREAHSIVLSRRAIVEEEQEKMAAKTWGELSVGQVREGTVRSVQSYGAFVDLGGVDGLLHVSAMSHTRVSDPHKIVKEGDKVQVMVIGVDREKNRVSLGLKQLSKDPFEEVPGKYPLGSKISGVVKKITEFGAFVELEPGVEGLVHISQLATKRVAKVSDVVKEGQQVEAKVTGIDSEKHRISLSIADLERDARAAANPQPAADASASGAAKTSAAPAAPTKPAQPARKKPLKGGL